jgi:hypothetical protein
VRRSQSLCYRQQLSQSKPSQFGNADEAKAIAKVIAAVKADKVKALQGRRWSDLYPFCFNISDGKHLKRRNQSRFGF